MNKTQPHPQVCILLLTRMLILFTVAVNLGTELHCQTHQWMRTNPGGGGAFSTIEAGPSGQIIAGSDLSGAYYSWDFGKTWNVYGSERGLNVTHVSGLGFHPTDGNIFFIGTDSGIYKSITGGGWLYEVLGNGYITDIAVAPSNTQIIYATYHPSYDSSNGSIYKSTDGGESFTQESVNIPNGHRLLELHVSPTNPNTVHVLSGNGRFACGASHLFKSIDGGTNWIQKASTLGEIMDVAMHPTNGNIMYLTTMNVNCNDPLYYTDLEGDFYQSLDGGDSWTLKKADRTGIIWIKRDLPSTIRMIDPREPWPWVATGGTWKSINSGSTWIKISAGIWDTGYQKSVDSASAPAWSYGSSYNGFCKTLGESLADPDALFWTNPQWVFATHDEGVNFNNLYTQSVSSNTWLSTGFDNIVMNEIDVNKKDPNILYMACADIGVWRSMDRGESWQSCNPSNFTGNWQGFGGNSLTVLSDPDRSNVVWAGMQGDFYQDVYLIKSDQSGFKSSWTQSDAGIGTMTRLSGLSLDVNSSTSNRTLYVSSDGDIYKSTNDGDNWSLIRANGALHFTAVDQVNGNTIYAAGRNGIHRSTNGGTSWADVSLPYMIGSEDVDYWEFGFEGVSSVTTHPTQAGWVYITVFGNDDGGIYMSVNSGTSWTKLYSNYYMRTVKINPLNSNQMYGGSSSAYYAGGFQSNSQGILYSDDAGSSWNPVNGLTAFPFATSIAFDQAAPQRIYIGSPGTGVQYAYVGGSYCDHQLTLEDPLIGTSYQAVESIKTKGEINLNQNTELQATQVIELNPGFNVPIGKTLSISTHLCGS